MSVEYKDYYKLLGVARDAAQEDIAKAFKKLARKSHPDLNPNDKTAENRFKEINEAYEVLRDPEKRRLYDQLGPDWQHGQNFQPPPGYENVQFHFGPGFEQANFDASGFSDFFEVLFGKAGQDGFRPGAGDFGRRGFGGAGARPRRGHDSEVVLELTLEEAYRGGSKSISLQEQAPGQASKIKTLQVNIPAGVKNGAKIRLAGQGSQGSGGGSAGDLYMKVRIADHEKFILDGVNVIYDLPLAPWEAVLGATVRVPTLDGEVDLTIPAGMDSGQKLRLRDRGLGQGVHRGDQFVRVLVKTPRTPSPEEKTLWEELARTSRFSAR